LNIYNLSKLLLKNLKNNGKTLHFIFYKNKKKIVINKNIPNAFKEYFEKFFKIKKKNDCFLFFSELRDNLGNTRKKQIENKIMTFMKVDIGLKNTKPKKFMEIINTERKTKRIGENAKLYFMPNTSFDD